MSVNNNLVTKDLMLSSGVYKLKCMDYDFLYIGQTGRNFNVRIMEHLVSIIIYFQM